MANKTNSKAVINAVQDHITDYVDYADYGCASTGDALKAQLQYMRVGVDSWYHTARHYVEGGSFLISNDDIQTEVQRWTDSNKAYPMDKTFELYVHLMAREIVRMAGL